MAPHRSTTTTGSEGARDGVGFTDPGREPEAPVFSEAPALRPGSVAPAGWFGRAAWGRVATGSVTAAGVESSSRDWMVPVTSPASNATLQKTSGAAGPRLPRRVTAHATPT